MRSSIVRSRNTHRTATLHPVALTAVLSMACSGPELNPPNNNGGSSAQGGIGGVGAQGGHGGAAGGAGNAAGTGTGGSSGSPSNGGTAAGTGPVGGASGAASGAGGAQNSGAGGGGRAGGGGTETQAGSSGRGGASGGVGGMAGAAGRGGSGGRAGAGGQGGAAGEGGSSGPGGAAGMGGAEGDPDRCDIANHNPDDPPQALTLTGNLGIHDPVAIFAHGRYYFFQTDNGIGAKTSPNLTSFQAAPRVFAANPSWIAQRVPEATNLWAPDISYFGGMYHLYYSASSFGKNTSCIGHASRAALDTGSWTDHGPVICSSPSDDWNAIDPNVVVDEDGKPWLSFGSFWGGLKLIELTNTGARSGTSLRSIAARPNNDGAIEAPFIVRRCGYYYLFVSFDSCCRGADSTYKIMVGRSTSVTGPYTDRQGTPMMEGGGTLVLQGNTRWRGPGHNAVLFTEDAAYNIYHSYDANNNGNPILRISELVWDAQGWPISGGP